MAWESESQTKQGFLLGQTRESSSLQLLVYLSTPGLAHPSSLWVRGMFGGFPAVSYHLPRNYRNSLL